MLVSAKFYSAPNSFSARALPRTPPALGELTTALPRPRSWFKGDSTSKGKGRVWKGREKMERGREGRRDLGLGLAVSIYIEFPVAETDRFSLPASHHNVQ